MAYHHFLLQLKYQKIIEGIRRLKHIWLFFMLQIRQFAYVSLQQLIQSYIMQSKAINTLQIASEYTFYLEDWQRPVKTKIIPKFSNYSAADIRATVIREGLLHMKRKSLNITSSNPVHKYAVNFNPRPTILQKNTIPKNKQKILPVLPKKSIGNKYLAYVLKKRHEQQKHEGLNTNLFQTIKIYPLKKVTPQYQEASYNQTHIFDDSKNRKSHSKLWYQTDVTNKKTNALKMRYMRSLTSNTINMSKKMDNQNQMENPLSQNQLQGHTNNTMNSISHKDKISIN